jgi:hypothetical protein
VNTSYSFLKVNCFQQEASRPIFLLLFIDSQCRPRRFQKEENVMKAVRYFGTLPNVAGATRLILISVKKL